MTISLYHHPQIINCLKSLLCAIFTTSSQYFILLILLERSENIGPLNGSKNNSCPETLNVIAKGEVAAPRNGSVKLMLNKNGEKIKMNVAMRNCFGEMVNAGIKIKNGMAETR